MLMVKTRIAPSRIAGIGVFADQDIPAGTVTWRFMPGYDLQALGIDEPTWLTEARAEWDEPVVPLGIRVAVPVWRDPWFVVGSSTFAGDVLHRLGLVNVFADSPERYPKVDVGALTSRDVDLVLLPDEPYIFSETDGPEAVHVRTALIDGRMLTWYGPSLHDAKNELLAAILAEQRALLQDEGRGTEGLDWQTALDSGMLDLIREGNLAEAKERLQACLSSSSD
mgnify:CR=1 FL=1